MDAASFDGLLGPNLTENVWHCEIASASAHPSHGHWVAKYNGKKPELFILFRDHIVTPAISK
jgi:hypothetical protein